MKKETIYLKLNKLHKEQCIEVYEVLKINNQKVGKATAKLLKESKVNEFNTLIFNCFWNQWELVSYNHEQIKFKNEISLDQFKELYKETTTHKVTIKTEDLEVGTTFEYNGYICEVKEKIEEKKWYSINNKKLKTFWYRKLNKEEFDACNANTDIELTEITDYHFINLLEKHSK